MPLDYLLIIMIFLLQGIILLQYLIYNHNQQKLVDKMMSKNFSEYAASVKSLKEKPIGNKEFKVQVEDPMGMNEAGVLDELNSFLIR